MNIYEKLGYVIVTDYIKADTGEDASDAIQKIIDDNPNKTIFFPDGEYVLAKPICTPADPRKSVSLSLSNYAVLKAADSWSDPEAMVRLGAIHKANDIDTNGSNYYFEGGIVDGGDLANGICIEGGRETRVANVSIKNTVIGLHLKNGANSASADADILNVNIVGRGTVDSVGVLVEACDNTFTNMRIASVQIGVKLMRSANCLRNIHPLYIYEKALEGTYADSIGFLDMGGANWYDFCYSDQFATGFCLGENCSSNFNNCFCYWYSDKGGIQNGMRAIGQFHASVKSFRVSYKHDTTKNAYLKVDEPGGNGYIQNPIVDDSFVSDKTYLDYLQGKVLISHPSRLKK